VPLSLLYFPGCTPTYRFPEVRDAVTAILERSGTDFVIPHRQSCCGSVLFRTGQTSKGEEALQETLSLVHEISPHAILTSCPGCLETLSNRSGLSIPVKHTTVVFSELIRQERIRVKKPVSDRVIYHDPCHLARGLEITEEPRSLLKQVLETPNHLFEFSANRKETVCCGAGGGVKAEYPSLATAIAAQRLEEIRMNGIKHVTTACPFCLGNFRSAAPSSFKVTELSTLLLEAMG